jgi:hypothetical protein
MPSGAGMPWPIFMLILLKRIADSGFISVSEIPTGMRIGSIKTTPDMIAITPKGREFIADLGISEM